MNCLLLYKLCSGFDFLTTLYFTLIKAQIKLKRKRKSPQQALNTCIELQLFLQRQFLYLIKSFPLTSLLVN